MNANIFMLFDCFLEEDQEVWGFGLSLGWGGNSEGVVGRGKGDGGGWGNGKGSGEGRSEGKGYISWGEGYGRSDDGDNIQPRPVLCLVEIRRPSNER